MSASTLANSLILVVDDDNTNREVLRLRLEKLGAGVVVASGGAEALSLLGGESARSYDAVLLDYMMPEITGLDVLRRIRTNRTAMELPVIMQTARTDSSAIVECLNSGANDYVTKPIDFAVLVARLSTHLDLRRLSAEKDSFLAMASHDLKTPLATVRGFSALLLELLPVGAVMTDRARDILYRIQRQSRAMERIITDILDIHAIENGQIRLSLEKTDLAGLVRDAAENAVAMASARAIAVHLDISDNVSGWTVDVDPHRLRQVLDNLIGNAMKFCPDGAEVEIRLRQHKRTVVIEVSDTGPGIPPADLTRIFNKHYRSTAKPASGEKSSGLGLCISKWLVELHGGRISAFNNYPGMGPGGSDAGATFRVCLPMGD